MNISERIKLYLLIIVLCGVPLFFDIRLHSVFDLSKFALLVLGAVGLLWWKLANDLRCMLRHPHPSSCKSQLYYPIALYFLSWILSSVVSINHYTSLFGEYKRYDGLISCICYMIVSYSMTNCSKQQIAIIIKSMIVCSVVIAVYGICQYHGIDYFEWILDPKDRTFSTFGNPVFLGAYLAILIPITYSLYLGSWRYTYSCLLFFILAIQTVCLIYTVSRGAIISAIIGVMIVSFLAGKQFLKNTIPIVLCSCIMLGIVGKPLLSRLHTITNNERILIYKSGLHIIKDYFPFGVGNDCVGIVYDKYKYQAEHEDKIHQDFLDIFATRGLFGLIVYIIFLIYLTKFLIRFSRYQSENRIFRLGLVGGIVAFICSNQVMFASLPVSITFWGVLGICICISRLEL